MDQGRDWARHEAMATGMLAEALSDYVALFDDTCRAYDTVLATRTRSGRPLSVATQVTAVLLTHSVTGLRCTLQAARSSYPMQAMDLAAGVFEQTHRAMYIGASDTRANDWVKHNNRWSWLPKDVRLDDVIRSAVAAMDPVYATQQAGDAEVARRKRIYRNLCMGKHGNPVALRRFGVLVEKGRAAGVLAGPYVGDNPERPARLVVAEAAEFVLLGLSFFVGQSQLTEAEAMALLPPVRALMLRVGELRARDLGKPRAAPLATG